MSTEAPLDDPAARPSPESGSTPAASTNMGPSAVSGPPARHLNPVAEDDENDDVQGSGEDVDGAEKKPANPHVLTDSEPGEASSRASREAIAARAFQVYSDHVTATARSMHETPTEELRRRHDKAANKAGHGLNMGHKLR